MGCMEVSYSILRRTPLLPGVPAWPSRTVRQIAKPGSTAAVAAFPLKLVV
jgi:hypothetical protein